MLKKVEGQKEEKKEEYTKGKSDVQPEGLLVFIAMSDGSIRSAEIGPVEHARTILNVLSLNERNGLILSHHDFSPELKKYFDPEDKKEEEDGAVN